MRVAPEVLDRALVAVEDLWSLPSRFDDNGVHHGYRQVTLYLAGHAQVAGFEWLEMFAPIRTAWLSRIEPGGYIAEHIDAGPLFERWQIPFTQSGSLSHNGQPVFHKIGVPFRVKHDDWHSVDNHTDHARVSLVIDRAVPIDTQSTPIRIRKPKGDSCPS